MAKEVKATLNTAENTETANIQPNTERKLGQMMHRISKQQQICVRENEKLKALTDEANKLDQELTKLDG